MNMQVTTPHMELWRIEGEFDNMPHAHEEQFQITIPIYGTCHLTQENRSYALAEGGALVQHPRDRHFFHIGAESGVIIFQVGRGSLQELSRQESLELALEQQFDPVVIQKKFRKWVSALLPLGPTDPLAVAETEAQVLHYLIFTLQGNHRSRVRTAAWSDAEGTDRNIGRVLDYMHAHYTQAVDIETLAAIALQSRFHFIRAFKSATGVTPYQYVLRLRVEDAKTQLRRTAKPVTEISFSLGFASCSQFYRAFGKFVGVTPEQYRSSGA